MEKEIEVIASSGVNINLKDKKIGRTALHYAAANGKTNKPDVCTIKSKEFTLIKDYLTN